MSGLVIRTARKGDEDMVLKLLYELADYERPDFIYTKERLLVPLPMTTKEK